MCTKKRDSDRKNEKEKEVEKTLVNSFYVYLVWHSSDRLLNICSTNLIFRIFFLSLSHSLLSLDWHLLQTDDEKCVCVASSGKKGTWENIRVNWKSCELSGIPVEIKIEKNELSREKVERKNVPIRTADRVKGYANNTRYLNESS